MGDVDAASLERPIEEKGDSMDKNVEQVAKEALAQAKAEGLDEDDAFWLAVGAVNHAARSAGVTDEDELSPEMNAASQAVVKQVKHGE